MIPRKPGGTKTGTRSASSLKVRIDVPEEEEPTSAKLSSSDGGTGSALPLPESKINQTTETKVKLPKLQEEKESISKVSLTPAQVLKEFIVSGQLKTETRKNLAGSKENVKKEPENLEKPQEQGGDLPVEDPNSKSVQVKLKDENDGSDGDQENEKGEETGPPPEGCEKCLRFIKKARGLAFSLVGSLQLSCASYLVRRLIHLRGYDAVHCVMMRFIGLFTFASLLLLYVQFKRKKNIIAKICPPKTKRQRCSSIKLTVRIAFGCASLICQVYALDFLEAADVSVIIFSNPVFVAFGAHLFLKEKCGFFHAFLAVLTVLGVVIISKPAFLVGEHRSTQKGINHVTMSIEEMNYSSSQKPGGQGSSTPKETEQAKLEADKVKGICLAVAAMLMSAGSVITLRMLKNVHFSVVNATFGFFGLILALIIAGSTHQFATLKEKPKEDQDYVMFASLAIMTFTGLSCSTLSLKYAEAGPISILKSSEVVFSFLWQLLSDVYPDGASLGGAAIVLLCIALTGFRQYLKSLPEDRKIKKIFWFVLR